MNKKNFNYDLIILIMTVILLLLLLTNSIISIVCNTKSDNKKETRQSKHYYLNNNVELTTMEIKDETIPLVPMSTKSNKLYSKVPLSASYQKWLDKKCKKYGVSTNVVLGVMKVESNFTKRMKKLSANNLLNAYDNATVGVDYLAELYKNNNKNWHKTLMAYNGGQYYANKNVKKGIYSSKYSRKVMDKAYYYKANRK